MRRRLIAMCDGGNAVRFGMGLIPRDGEFRYPAPIAGFVSYVFPLWVARPH